MRWFALALLALVSCTSPHNVSVEAARLRASFEPHRAEYLQAIELENSLVPRSLEWIKDPAPKPGSRPTCVLMDSWARAFFRPRVIHGKLRTDEYNSTQVKDVHRRMLDHLQQRYIILHDYQRYAQAECNTDPRRPDPIAQAARLKEFRQRLESHPRATDEITPLLASLPN